jgi:glycosyltransferase involved in cell wall biosynthesis
MKIAFVGPTYPYRGGISHYTTLICGALRKHHEVKLFSFKRQYPRVFYRGKCDRDPSQKGLALSGTEFIIDSINPLTWKKAARAITTFSPDMLIVPWWSSYWMFAFGTILSFVKRQSSCTRVMICHNVEDHESHPLSRWATRQILSYAHRIVAHSQQDVDKLKALFGDRHQIVLGFIPSHGELSPDRYSKEESKKRLNLTGPVLMFFGFVRQYKGLGVLLDALPLILKEKKITLLIVGEFWKDKNVALEKIKKLGLTDHVRVIDRYIPNEELGIYFGAADLVVQPYISGTGSGICLLAFGFDRPVVATHVGQLSEVIEDGVNGRLVQPGDVQGLARAVVESLEPENLDRMTQKASQSKHLYTWERLADLVSAGPNE